MSQHRLFNQNKKLRQSSRNFEAARSSYESESKYERTGSTAELWIEKISPIKHSNLCPISSSEVTGVPKSLLDSTGVTSFDKQRRSMIMSKRTESASKLRVGSLREMSTRVTQFFSRDSQRLSQRPIPTINTKYSQPLDT